MPFLKLILYVHQQKHIDLNSYKVFAEVQICI